MENTSTKLQQKALQMAMGGNGTLMVFCLKNLAKWSDKQETTLSAPEGITLNYKV